MLNSVIDERTVKHNSLVVAFLSPNFVESQMKMGMRRRIIHQIRTMFTNAYNLSRWDFVRCFHY